MGKICSSFVTVLAGRSGRGLYLFFFSRVNFWVTLLLQIERDSKGHYRQLCSAIVSQFHNCHDNTYLPSYLIKNGDSLSFNKASVAPMLSLFFSNSISVVFSPFFTRCFNNSFFPTDQCSISGFPLGWLAGSLQRIPAWPDHHLL